MAPRIPKKLTKKSRDSFGGKTSSSASGSSLVSSGNNSSSSYFSSRTPPHSAPDLYDESTAASSANSKNDTSSLPFSSSSSKKDGSVTKSLARRAGKFAGAAADTMKKMHPISSSSSSSSNHDQTLASGMVSTFASPGGSAVGSTGSNGGSSNSSSRARPSNSKNPFETSDGAMRLNRILDQKMNDSSSSAVGGSRHRTNAGSGKGTAGGFIGGEARANTHLPHGGVGAHTSSDGSPETSGYESRISGSVSHPSPPSASLAISRRANFAATSTSSMGSKLFLDYVPPSTVQLADPTDELAVGDMTCRISAKQRVDSRSIGGMIVAGDGKVEARTGNVLLREGWEEQLQMDDVTTGASPTSEGGIDSKHPSKGPQATNAHSHLTRPINRLTNECLLSMCVSQFDLSVGLSGGPSGGKKRHIPIAKTRNKLRYVVILRSTNRPLLRPQPLGRAGVDGVGMGGRGLGDDDEEEDNNDDDLGSDDGYDHMYNPEPSEADPSGKSPSRKKTNNSSSQDKDLNNVEDIGTEDGTYISAETGTGGRSKKAAPKLYEEYDSGISPEREISSFPALLCLAIHADGTKPDVRKVLELDKLVSIENSPPRKNDVSGSAGYVVLVFRNGDAVEIDCDLPNAVMHATGAGAGGGPGGTSGGASDGVTAVPGVKKKNLSLDATNRLRKERFLWSLLQIHAILCTAVVERTTTAAALIRPGGVSMARSQLPPLVVRNVDRGELQYISTVNGFLTDSPVLCALLDRQSNRGRGLLTSGGIDAEEKKSDDAEDGKSDEMDGMAYDMMMGNYNRVTLFINDEEQKDAAEVLNSTAWQQQEITSDGMTSVDASATAETLMRLLQQRMRDLEAETCRRLISWEDEKFLSASGERPAGNSVGSGSENTMDAMSLNDLFQTLQSLDDELDKMELWIQDRATMIKPITDECRGIEEENRMLEQQWISYETLGSELKRLLGGLVLPPGLMKVLENPGSVIVYERSGAVDIGRSEEGVDFIHQAGQALKLAIDTAEREGGIHLRAVSDTIKVLMATSNLFCKSLAQIVVTVMEQLAKGVCARTDATIGKSDTHSSIAKKIRETQQRFQESLLSYIKIIEVLALLNPDILPAVRDAYSELVAEGIMSKKRMKLYFASLPGRTSVKIAHDVNFDAFPGRSSASATHDLSEYTPVSLRNQSTSEAPTMMKPVNVEDIEAALSEMLPLIAREAYFTAALFGLSSRHLDGRQKKRNFEAAKKSVDNSSQYFRYYMNRICGIASEVDAEGKKVKGDAMLSLVASIHLNEAMDGYIDRHKKGGDHSLSLAYVRATILDLRKKVDKQWVIWVEEQIRWIRTNPGVPLNGKRAGIFASISRFPSYLDHVLICCKAGRPNDYTPNLSKIKVVSYYLQKMASGLFASLNDCAERESTDQQYASNVMRMENSYFFTQSIKQRGTEFTNLFQKQITGASVICKQSTDAYLGWMIKREFKAMHSLFSNISRIRKDVGDADVPIHVPRAQFVRTLQKESSKEIMKEKIGVVYARMEKHLSESGGLLPVAWKALVKVLYEWFGRWEKLSTSCYKFILEPSAIDVVRLAKAASGVTMPPTKKAIESKSGTRKHDFVAI